MYKGRFTVWDGEPCHTVCSVDCGIGGRSDTRSSGVDGGYGNAPMLCARVSCDKTRSRGQDFKRVRALEFKELRASRHLEFKGSDPLEILTPLITATK